MNVRDATSRKPAITWQGSRRALAIPEIFGSPGARLGLSTGIGKFSEQDAALEREIEQHLRRKHILVVMVENGPRPGRVVRRFHAAVSFQHITEVAPELADIVMQTVGPDFGLIFPGN